MSSGNGNVKTLDKTSMELCRVCLASRRELVSLFLYRPNGSYAEMLTSITKVQVSVNDGLVDKICCKCACFLNKVMKFKRVAEESDRRFRARYSQLPKKLSTKKISFDTFKEIKNEMESLNIKKEPKVEVEIEVLTNQSVENPAESIKGKDIVICNTVIRKVDPTDNGMPALVPDFSMDCNPDISWKNIKKDESNLSDYGADDFQDDISNYSDDDIPLALKKAKLKKTKTKTKFKKPKISEIKVFKENLNKSSVKTRKVKMSAKILDKREQSRKDIVRTSSNNDEDRPSTYITCYPLLKNGAKGPPLILKRPKDATVLKTHPNYRPRIYNKQKDTGKTISMQDSRSKPIPKITRTVGPANIKPREKHVCPVCGVLTYGLANHMATHSEKKRYSCSQCNRTFAQKNNMLVHLKTHSGVKDHICEVCGAGFYCQKSLLRHNLIHKGERPFGCSLCTKRFIARCDLTRHLRIHSGYKPFKCNVCTMSFNAKHQLQNHERMHTGEKPYSCQVCNVAFSYKVNLNNHVYKVHGVNLKFKSIHTITEEVLRKEHELISDARSGVMPPHILPLPAGDDAPQPPPTHQPLY